MLIENNETVVTPAEETTTPPESTEETGAEEMGSEVTPPAGDTTKEGGEGTGEDDGQTPKEDNTKRVNDLMSKWQGEQHDHKQTKGDLDVANAEIERLTTNKGETIEDDDTPSYRKKGWEPKTIGDIQNALIEAEDSGARRAEESRQGDHNASQEAETQLNNFITEVEAVDKEFDSKSFYEYADSHKFPLKSISDLRAVYSSFVELRVARVTAGKDAVDNKNKRNTPVSSPKAGSGEYKGTPYSQVKSFANAKDAIDAHFNN